MKLSLICSLPLALGLVIPKVEIPQDYFEITPSCQEQLMIHSNTQRYWDIHEYIMGLKLDDIGMNLLSKEMGHIKRYPNATQGIVLTRENLHFNELNELGLINLYNDDSKLFNVSDIDFELKTQFHSIEPIVIPKNTTGLFLFNNLNTTDGNNNTTTQIKLLDYFLFVPFTRLNELSINLLNNTNGKILFYENDNLKVIGDSPVLISILQQYNNNNNDKEKNENTDDQLIHSKWMKIIHNELVMDNRYCVLNSINNSLCFQIDSNDKKLQITPLFDSFTNRLILNSQYYESHNFTNIDLQKRSEPVFKIQVIDYQNEKLKFENSTKKSDFNKGKIDEFQNIIFGNMKDKELPIHNHD